MARNRGNNMKDQQHILAFVLLSGFVLSVTTIILFNANSLLLKFIFFYAVVSFSYLFYRYFFGIINYPLHFFKHDNINYEPSVSIVIPCYNEEKKYLINCIKSACTANYPKKEVIVVDDGSSDKEVWKTINELKKTYSFKAFRYSRNKGKRSAMALGFRKAINDVIITVDSDSVITSGRAIRELMKPLVNKQVGTVSGCILVKNIEKTLITKIQDARYWMAFFIEKSSQNPYNSVTCASGPFSAYKREYLMDYLDEWENQVFLGQTCTYGDDRGLTTLMLRNGYDVKFSRDALLYTNVPETLAKFIKQQIRWKKSFIRENWYLLQFILKKNVLMNVEFFLFWTVFLSGFIAKLLTFYLLLFGSVSIVNYALMLLFVTFLHYIYTFIKSPGKRGYYGVIYGFLNEFIFSWLFFYALATLKDVRWGTR